MTFEHRVRGDSRTNVLRGPGQYFYQRPWRIGNGAEIEVTCDYHTLSAQGPVLPGWGTSNEICLTTLLFTAPKR